MPVFEEYDEAAGGTLINRVEVPEPAPDPGDVIAAVAAMTDQQKADLRAALGL